MSFGRIEKATLGITYQTLNTEGIVSVTPQDRCADWNESPLDYTKFSCNLPFMIHLSNVVVQRSTPTPTVFPMTFIYAFDDELTNGEH